MDNDAIIINYTGRRGGGPVCALEMSRQLLLRGQRVIPILSEGIENLEDWNKVGFERIILIKTYNSRVSFLLNTLFFFVRKRKIAKEIKGYNISAVYSPMITFWTGKINKIFRKAPKIIVVHDPTPHSGSNRFFASILDKPFKQADALIVHSKQFIDFVKDRYNKKTFYIPLGSHAFYKTKVTKPISLYDDKRINFLFFGRIEDYKGLALLGPAYKKLEEKYGEKVFLMVAGDGDFSPYVKAFSGIKNIRVENRWIPDSEVADFFTGKNLVCVCPYKDATQSGIVVTSYSFKVPVIATNVGGLDEQVYDGKTGLLIEPNSVEAISKSMERFVTFPSLISSMSDNTEEYLKENSWEEGSRILLEIIDSLNTIYD